MRVTIIKDLEQGTQAWLNARSGIITASRFKDLMSTARDKKSLGAAARTYMYELLAEKLTGGPLSTVSVKAMQWGHECEAGARSMYSMICDEDVQQVGMVLAVNKSIGCSPDGVVMKGEDIVGGCEIKCPINSSNHVRYTVEGGVPKDYYWQVQGAMWVTGASWWDFVSYDPRMPQGAMLYRHREYHDASAMDALDERSESFINELNRIYSTLS